ncbi:hypothetical protein [Polluticaenibacter yanchengensis]|uniref:DUF4397 domain-containing protein n=1 Tax=Polluticaenibacter yanchengensis TaxID=3014562 RepID=A0ABT4UKS8_9BACT|nr:hypothetical protein [Chitinophagaceae bacterium LY-5]
MSKNRHFYYSRFFIFLITAVITFCFYACKKENDHYNAQITYANLSPEIRNLNLAFANNAVNPDNAFNNWDAFDLPSYYDTLKWSYDNDLAAPDSSYLVSLKSNARYTYIVYDSLDKAKVFFQRNLLPSSYDKSKTYYRFFNALHDADSLYLSIYVNDTTNRSLTSATAFGNFLASNSYTAYDTVTTKLWLKNKSVALDSITDFQLVRGQYITVIAAGILNNNGVYKPQLKIIETKE